MTINQRTIKDFSNHQDTIIKMLSALQQQGWDITYYDQTEFYARRVYDVDGDAYIEFGTVQGEDQVGLAYFTPAYGNFFNIKFSLTNWKSNVSKIIKAEKDYRSNSLIKDLEEAYNLNIYRHKQPSELLDWIK